MHLNHTAAVVLLIKDALKEEQKNTEASVMVEAVKEGMKSAVVTLWRHRNSMLQHHKFFALLKYPKKKQLETKRGGKNSQETAP